jgi:uncharacterized protein YjeT (DUF2065 family)
MTPVSYFKRLREGLRFKFGPKLAKWLIADAIRVAEQKIKQAGKVSILVDNTILGHATLFKTGWVSTGVKKWGTETISTGYAARMPTYAPDQSELYRNVTFLPGIAELAKSGLIQLFSSAELRDETYRQPSGRFIGYGYYDFNIFNDLDIPSIDGNQIFRISSFGGIFPKNAPENLQRNRLNNIADPAYEILVKLMGARNSQDAFHLLTAERYQLFCFLTMDFKFRRTWKSVRRNKAYPLTTPVMTPQEFGLSFGIKPVHPHILSYTKARFPVRPDLLAPGKPGK